MLPVKHADHDAKEAADFRHRQFILVVGSYRHNARLEPRGMATSSHKTEAATAPSRCWAARRLSEIELSRPAEDCGNFNGPGLAPVHHAVTAYDDLTNVRRVSFGYDPARFGKCPQSLDRRHDSAYGQVRIERRIEGDVCPNRFKIPKGLW